MLHKSNSAAETKQIAAGIAASAKPGDVFCLYGPMGAGKTAFAQGFAKGMGYEGEVNSPTFTLVHEYLGGRLPVYHFDLYRLGDGGQARQRQETGPVSDHVSDYVNDQVEALGYEEYFYGNGVCLIEWPELAEGLMPENARKITITPDYGKDAGYREIHDYSIG